MTDVAEIATRAERGDVAGQLLRELASAIWTWTHCPEGVDTDLWVTRWNTFHKFLTINTPEAHLAAAMMLVPDGEGHDPFRLLKGCNPNNRSRGCRAEIWIKNSHRPLRGSGPTPAHALIAAIARNMVTDEDRKAAAEWMAERMALVMGGESGSGEQSLIEAFARHRIATEVAAEQRGYQQGMEEAAGALEADAQLCDCHAHSESECACGAWCEWKTITSARAVEIVRAKAEEKKHG